MDWLLGTHTLIFAARDRPAAVRRRLEAVSPDDVAVSSIAVAELWFGAEKSEDPPRKREAWRIFLGPCAVLPFDRAAGEEHARLRHLLRHSPIGERDLLVAAIAVANRLKVVSNSLEEFARVPGLVVEDWSR